MKIYIIIIIYIVFFIFNKAYFKFYPTIPIYPNSKSELVIVKKNDCKSKQQ